MNHLNTRGQQIKAPPNPENPNPKPGIRNTKPETRNPTPETPNLKPETRNPKPETRNPEGGGARVLLSYCGTCSVLAPDVISTCTGRDDEPPQHPRPANQGTRNPNPESRNPKPETRNLKP
ncbi:hypothetical protein T484DRAFT_1631645 [Baffinella frigidus]|nr:hypothetical protein T484DRAFT_1631645 [Cryptophyta sp. CCMP2293]